MRNICLEHYKAEYDMQMKYHPQTYDLLENLMSSNQDDHFKKLDQIHDKEVWAFFSICDYGDKMRAWM